MQFTTYENRGNAHVAIHKSICSQIRKRGGEHAHGQGEYHEHENFEKAKDYAKTTGHPIVECSYCEPAS